MDDAGEDDDRCLYMPYFDDEFRFSKTVQGKKLVSKLTQSKSAPLEHVLTQGLERRERSESGLSTSGEEVDPFEGKDFVVKVLKSKYFFAQLRTDLFQEIISSAVHCTCEEQQCIYTEGDEIKCLLLIESGKFFSLRSDSKSSLSNRAGDFVASMEEIRNRCRSSTMTALASGSYWTIDIKAFKRACKVFMESLDHRFLTQVDFLLYLQEDHLLECSFHLQVLNIPRDKSLCHYVDTGKHLYILRKGSIEDKESNRLISSHQVFGEGDIFSNKSSIENFRCSERALVLQLQESVYSYYLSHGLLGIFEDKIKIGIVQEISKLKKVHGQRLDDIFNLFEEKKFDSGTALAMPGEALDSLVILKKGELVEVEEMNGRMVSRDTLAPYHVFGVSQILRSKKPKTGICVKSDSATCIILSKDSLTQALKEQTLRRNSSFIAERVKVPLKKRYKSKASSKSKYSLGDFRPTKTLGQGQFGVVLQVQHLKTKKVFALKVQYRREIEELGQVERVRQERLSIGRLNHPGIVKFISSFKDEKAVYLLMEAVKGGELFYHLEASSSKRFNEHIACFIGASILGALQHIHQCGLIYRDLKPENILLDSKGYPKLVDFGCAKISEDTNMTMCGTPEYVPPELIQGLGYDYRSDYWQFGVLLYEMICGFTPFEPGFCADHATKARLIYEQILSGRVDFPRHVSCEAKDLIGKLLVLEPNLRFDGELEESAAAVQNHPWFRYHKMSPDLIAKRKISAPLAAASENSFQPNMGMINFTRVPQPNTSSTDVLDEVF